MGSEGSIHGLGSTQVSDSVQSGQNYAELDSAQLLSDGCDYDSAGIIERYTANQDIPLPDGESSGKTVAQDAADGTLGASYSKVASYYYVFNHPQAACNDSDTVNNLQSSTITAVEEVAAHLQAQ